MKRFIVLTIILLPSIVFGQNFVMTWQQCYGGTGDDKVQSIIPYNNGYLFFGSTYSIDGNVSNNICDDLPNGTAWLVNIDAYGEIIFNKSYCGTGGAFGKKIMPIGNDFYFFGSTGPNNYGGINGFWLAKADSNLNIIWQDVLGGSFVERPKSGCVAHDGGVIETGITGSPDGDIEEHYGDFDNWLVKMNPDGSRGWIKTYGNKGGESGGSIIPTYDGGYIYACSGYNELPGNTYCEGHDGMMAEAWLIKMDANGEKEWHQCYGGSHIDLIRDIIELDNGYIIIGSTDSDDGDIPNHHGIVGENTDIWVIKTDLDGEITWNKCFGGSDWETSFRIFKNDNSTYTIFGITKSNDYDVQGNYNTSNSYVVWMFIIDENGELIYQKPFSEIPSVVDSPDFIRVSDYKYIAAVTKNKFGCNHAPNEHNEDIYIFEIQDMDEFIPSQAIGADQVCLGVETQSHYTTELVIDTMETQWLLTPEEAGNITSYHDSILINWNLDFNDTAWLQVRAVNEYGESAYSEPKEIIISPALNLSEIIGPDSVCTVHNEPTELYIQNEDQLMINWYIEPQEAGAITILNDTALINWNPQFEGQTILKYAALNKCDQEEFSSDKEIFVQSCVGVNKLQGYYFQVYPNPASTQVTFDYQLPIGKEKAQLIIRNTEGKQVAQFQLTNESGQKVWDTRSLNAGTYIYEYVCDDLKQTGKIVIVK